MAMATPSSSAAKTGVALAQKTASTIGTVIRRINFMFRFDFARTPNHRERVIFRKPGQFADAAFARDRAFPLGIQVGSQGRDGVEAEDDGSEIVHAVLFNQRELQLFCRILSGCGAPLRPLIWRSIDEKIPSRRAF